jgi:DNA-binding transcriptional regulator YhcF (GntR family)
MVSPPCKISCQGLVSGSLLFIIGFFGFWGKRLKRRCNAGLQTIYNKNKRERKNFVFLPLTCHFITCIVSYISNEPTNNIGSTEVKGLEWNLSSEKSIYLQIGERIETEILRDILLEEERVPSTNELANAYSINPATAAKGINLLVDQGILYKKRGIGMFVASGAKQQIIQKRKGAFYEGFILNLVREAQSLAITEEELVEMIRRAKEEKATGEMPNVH